MLVTLDEVKNYLRISSDDDDALLEYFLQNAQQRCLDILRVDTAESVADTANLTIGICYCVAYMYEHREEADYGELNRTMRDFFFGDREAVF